MLYTLEQGPTEQFVIKQAILQRGPIPERILNAPELKLGLELFFEGFFELSSTRAYGFGEGPIPWTSIDRYCCFNEIENEQRDDFCYFVRMMDAVYLEWRSKKLKEKTDG